MKKIFLLLFSLFSSVIFYQFILSKNGLLEGYRVKKEKEQLLFYKKLWDMKRDELSNYIDFLKNDPEALKMIANKLGYFNEQNAFIKIIDEINDEKNAVNDEIQIDKLFEEYKLRNNYNKKINMIRFVLQIFFFVFFGFFIFLVIFGIRKRDNDG